VKPAVLHRLCVQFNSNVHCGDGAVDDARFPKRNVRDNDPVNTRGRLAGLANNPSGVRFLARIVRFQRLLADDKCIWCKLDLAQAVRLNASNVLPPEGIRDTRLISINQPHNFLPDPPNTFETLPAAVGANL